ncbi:hypothetical protein IHE44_0014727, partial [Lamprotornis superbus]
MPESAVRPGQLCCVMVCKWWYRVIIHRVINDQEVALLEAPCSGHPMFLGMGETCGVLLFKHLCRFKELVGIVDEYVDGVLYLFLCDTSSKEDVYFHSVLRDMGYADVCGENVPSQEFEKLNPSALYVQPSGKQGNPGVGEPDLCLQQESQDEDSETATLKLDGAE